tara:strand:+ start:375 stop:692 length:318 start_codon:yes stop_codon:yes gene_type:complete
MIRIEISQLDTRKNVLKTFHLPHNEKEFLYLTRDTFLTLLSQKIDNPIKVDGSVMNYNAITHPDPIEGVSIAVERHNCPPIFINLSLVDFDNLTDGVLPFLKDLL